MKEASETSVNLSVQIWVLTGIVAVLIPIFITIAGYFFKALIDRMDKFGSKLEEQGNKLIQIISDSQHAGENIEDVKRRVDDVEKEINNMKVKCAKNSILHEEKNYS